MEVPSWLQSISDVGIVVVLAVILWGGAKRWWVFGWAYDAKVREAEEWKRIALQNGSIADTALSKAEASK